jgi:RNA polymerase sigma factor (sigma-70 family)
MALVIAISSPDHYRDPFSRKFFSNCRGWSQFERHLPKNWSRLAIAFRRSQMSTPGLEARPEHPAEFLQVLVLKYGELLQVARRRHGDHPTRGGVHARLGESASDSVQELYTKLLRLRRDEYPIREVAALVNVMLRNQIINTLRKAEQNKNMLNEMMQWSEYSSDWNSDLRPPEELPDTFKAIEAIEKAIKTEIGEGTDDHRLFLCVYGAKMTHSETADLLKVTAKTVEHRVANLKARLKSLPDLQLIANELGLYPGQPQKR